MAQADGTILIDTEINADGMKAGSKEVEAAVRNMAKSVENLGTKAKTALNKQVDAFTKLNAEYSAQQKKVDNLKKKVQEYGKQKIPTAEYKEIQNQIAQAEKKLNSLLNAQEKFIALGGKEDSQRYKSLQYDIDELANTIRYAEGELKDLEESGKAFTLGSETKEAVADMQRLEAEMRKLSDMNNRLGTSYSSIKGQVNDYKNNLLKTDAAQKKASKSGERLNKSLRNTGKAAKSANFGLGKMLGTSILFSFVFRAISGVTNAIKDGFTNLAQYSSETNASISMLWGSLETLKNSLATAFAPILNTIAPILSAFIDMLSTAASYVSMFFAILSGKDTYTRAVAVQKDYAASLQDTASAAGAAADEMERYLSPLDDINRFTPTDSGGGGGGGGAGGGSGSGPLFEEVPIDSKFSSLLDTVLDKLKAIKNLFVSGFWDGLGDYKPIIEELKNDLSSIGASLQDIFMDADVQAAAQRFFESFIYNIGRNVGALTSIGLTMASLIVGGIESYLSENTDRIKGYVIRIFDIGSEVFTIIGDLNTAIAEIFQDVFGSQVAQDFLGDIIGIFGEVLLFVEELGLSIGRDLINFIAQPIIENKDAISNALLNTIGPIETMFQGIETFVQGVATSIMSFYNTYLSPFLQSLADAVSQILGVILEVYNTYIAPVLDLLAQKFTETLNGPVGQAINSVLGLLGKVINAIQLLWENLLVPLISWIVSNIMPVLGPIIETLGTIIMGLFDIVGGVVSGIADALGGLIDFIVGIFTGNWEKAWQGIKDFFTGIWNAIVSFFTGIWNLLVSIVTGAVDIISSIITAVWNGIKSVTSTVWNFISGFLSGIWNGLKSAVSTAFNFIKTIITNVWNGIKSITSSIWNGILGVIKGVINGIIGGINGMIRGVCAGINAVIGLLNKIHITIPDWVPGLGGASFGFSLPTLTAPQIPYLASGAVIPPNREFLAVLGDQNQGNNIEAPEGLLRRIVREETGNGNGLQRIEVPVYLNSRQIAKAVVDGAKMIRTQTGRNPLELA